jgi:hypothetical protein
MTDIDPVSTDDLLQSFEEAYRNGDSERIARFWDMLGRAIEADREHVLNSLLDDLSDGKDVKPFLETMPEDIEFEGLPDAPEPRRGPLGAD